MRLRTRLALVRPSVPLALTALFFLAACRTTPPAVASSSSGGSAPSVVPLTIVATNDVHGWLMPHEKRLQDGRVLREGGLGELSGYVDIARRKNPGGVLLVDAGDLFQGTLAANLTEGAAVIEVFNQLGYDAAALGNHEFDYGPVGPVSIKMDPATDAFGALKARIAEAKFPLLAANIHDAASGERPGWLGNDGTALVERNGIRIGLVGLITPGTASSTNPVNVASLRFSSLVPEATAAAERLRARGADVVIALVHAGGRCAQAEPVDDLSSCDTGIGEVWPLMNELPPGTLDAVVAGHTHSPIAKTVKGVPIVETDGLARSFALIELFIDRSTRRPIPSRTRLTPRVGICSEVDATEGGCQLPVLEARAKAGTLSLTRPTFLGEPVVTDPAVQATVARARTRVEAEQHRPLGLQVPKTLGRDYHRESALGSFLADSLREMEKADVALLNSGGLRADLPRGALTFGDVYQVLPFDNSVASVTVTGEELGQLLRAAYGAHKGVFQISGAKVSLRACPGKGRLRAFVLEDGRPPDPKRLYRVAMPDFLARGGDGLGAMLETLPAKRIDLGTRRPLNIRDALIAFWQKRGKPLVAPPLGRLVVVEDPNGCAGGAPGEAVKGN